MSFQTKQTLDNSKFQQLTDSNLNLSGNSVIYGKLSYVTPVTITGNTQLTHKQYVDNLIGLGSGQRIEKTFSQVGHTFVVGDVIGYDSSTTTFTGVTATLNSVETLGVVSSVSGSSFTICFNGYFNFSGTSVLDDGGQPLSAGTVYYLSTTTLGKLTPIETTVEDTISKPILVTITSGDSVIYNYRGNLISEPTTGTTGSSNVTASNGLTKVGDDIRLGGTLTGNTIINTDYNQFRIESTTDYNNLIEFASWGGLLMNTSIQYIMEANLFTPSQGVYFGVKDSSSGSDYATQLSLNSPGATPNTTGGKGVSVIAITPNSIDTGIETALTVGRSSGTFPYTMSPNFGVAIDFMVNMNDTPQTAQLKYQLTGVTDGAEEGKYTFSVHKAGDISDILDIDGFGLKYTEDFSSNYTSRSLVDYGFITGVTAATQVSVGNGLSFGLDNRIELGGSGDSAFVAMSGSNLTLTHNNPSGSVMLIGSSALEETGTFVYMHQIGSEQPQYEVALRLAPTLARFIDNRDETKGIEYQDDYSAFYTPRSLVDMGFVTGLTSGVTQTNIESVTTSTTLESNIDIALVTASASLTITLPTTPIANKILKIKDRTGNALTNNIIIDGNGRNIDGASTAILNTNWSAIELLYVESFDEYYIISFVS